MSKLKISSLFSLALALSIPACANTVTVSAGPFSSVPDLSSTSFDGGSVPINFVAFGSNTGIVSGSVTNQYEAPSGDATPYAYVGTGSSMTINYAGAPLSVFGLYWGSIDSYNSIGFTDTNHVTTWYGANGMSLAGILPVDTDTSAFVTFWNSGALWTSVQIVTNAPAFEFDNVATTTPEPASFAVVAGGLLACGFGAFRRRQRRK